MSDSTQYKMGTTGGSGFTILTATETPNGNLTDFTFPTATAQPSFILADFAQKPAVNADGTVNWTWNNGTKVASLSVPPTNDISAIQ